MLCFHFQEYIYIDIERNQYRFLITIGLNLIESKVAMTIFAKSIGINGKTQTFKIWKKVVAWLLTKKK